MPALDPTQPTPSEAELPGVKRLRRLVDDWVGTRVLLLGDVAADIYIQGRTHRISREAPVLIVRQTDEFVVPGQAGNVAMNLAALGAQVNFGTITGNDGEGKRLKQALEAQNVDCHGWVESASLRTLTKTRVLAGSHHTRLQQLVRIDREEERSAHDDERAALLDWLDDALPKADIVVVSDYGYQTLDRTLWTWLRDHTRRLGVELVLDSRYRGEEFYDADLITPNELEAMEMSALRGDTEPPPPEELVRSCRDASGARAVLLKRGNEGMCLLDSGEKIDEDYAEERLALFGVFGVEEAVDVSGAGDTVVAAAAMARAAGGSWLEAAHLANVAAGLTVLRMGAASTTPQEILRALMRWPDDLQPAG